MENENLYEKEDAIIATIKDIVNLEYREYGYTPVDGPIKLKGRTKMCGFYREYMGARPEPFLLSTYETDDLIESMDLSIVPWIHDWDRGGEAYPFMICSFGNNSPRFKQILEELGIDDFEDRKLDLHNPKFKEIITQIFNTEQNLDIDENNSEWKYKSEDIADFYPTEVLFDSRIMVYNTSFPREVNEVLINNYFDIYEEFVTNENLIEEFISYHIKDLIECFGGNEQLKEYVLSLSDRINGLDALIEMIMTYSPQEHDISEITDIVSDRKLEDINKVVAEISEEMKDKSKDNEQTKEN